MKLTDSAARKVVEPQVEHSTSFSEVGHERGRDGATESVLQENEGGQAGGVCDLGQGLVDVLVRGRFEDDASSQLGLAWYLTWLLIENDFSDTMEKRLGGIVAVMV